MVGLVSDLICARALKYSKASPQRMQAMLDCLEFLDWKNIPGDIVECGVWRGGHLILARLKSPHRHCWAYDTFSGMTAPGPHDVKRSGRSANKLLKIKTIGMSVCSLQDVEENFRAEGVLDHNFIRFIVGDVMETLQQADNVPDKIALLRLDTDWYESTKIELEVLFPRLVPGGILIVDDYGHWMGAKKAVDEYFDAAARQKLKPIDYTAVMMER